MFDAALDVFAALSYFLQPMSKASETPVMRQYLAAKSAHPDALLFFRLGDFYELFFEDAVVAARALDLTLTARNKGAVDEVPMAGVPYHAASGYVQKLLDLGHRVAICEQMADPATVKGIVPREVVRVVCPGIAYDDAGLDARTNHYLAAVDRLADAGPFGVAALDLSTGELLACEAPDEATALAELQRLEPREVLLGPLAHGVAKPLALSRAGIAVRCLSAGVDSAADVLDAQFGAGEALASCSSEAAREASARCVVEARDCEAGRTLPVSRLVFYDLGGSLVLDAATQANLELVRTVDGGERGSVLAAIDLTETAPGARLLRRRLLAPLARVPEIRRRHDGVELFVTHSAVRADVRAALAKVGDIERLAVKLAVGRAVPRDLVALRKSLSSLPLLTEALDRCPDPSARGALGVPGAETWLDECRDMCARLERAISDDPPPRASDAGVIRDGFDASLDESRSLMRDGQKLVIALEGKLRELSGISTLKLRYTRVFGWYIEVTRSQLTKAPSEWRRKQTVASGERFTCDELDELADRIAHAEERSSARELDLYSHLVRDLGGEAERLRAVAARLAAWDVAAALAEVAHRDDWTRPEVDESEELCLEDSRHPVVEKLASAGRFVPNDVSLGAGEGRPRLWLVTGPNMAGKSTLMRQTAIAVILAQMGAFVPARRAHVGVVDRVLTRVGASDNLSRGESTFMVEMKETANVLRRATRRSLVVLDEIGRGTSTYDGLAIAWAVAEQLHDVVGCRAMFATHYHELTELAATRAGTCENWSVSAREHDGELVFLHKLARGAASRSYGVACARLAGVPEAVVARARALLDQLEKGAASRSGPSSPERLRLAVTPQLDLFQSVGASRASHPVLDTLRAVDLERVTPLDAFALVVALTKMASQP